MKKLELTDFLQYRYLSGLTFSPDGNAAAFAVSQAEEETNSYLSHLWLYEGGKLRQLTGLGKERSFWWEDDTHILFPAARTDKEKERAKSGEAFTALYRIDIHGGEAVKAYELPFAADGLKKVSETLYAFSGSISLDCPDLYAMTPEEKKAEVSRQAEEKDYEVFTETPFWFNGAGVVNGKRQALFLYHTENGAFERITPPLFDLVQIEVKDGRLYYTGAERGSTAVLYAKVYRYDPRTRETAVLYGKDDLSISWFALTEAGIWLMATDASRYGLNENARGYLLDEVTGALRLVWENEEALGGSVGSDCRLGEGRAFYCRDGRIDFITTRGGSSVLHELTLSGEESVLLGGEGSMDGFDRSPTGDVLFFGLYDNSLQELYTLRNGEKVRLSSFNQEALEGVYVAAPQELRVQSHGEEIVGWILTPKDFDPAKTYPAILDIHGGPKTVYGPVFYHEMQLWASEGWFVLFCNPTGSDGRGNEFADIRGKYGSVDYDNLMDFTDAALSAYPQIDPKRVAVTGGSYGGFMTNWIIGHTDRFACAATQRSISNWLSFAGTSDIGPYFTRDQMGVEAISPETVWRYSPLGYAGNAVTPTLFIHSDEDFRCPLPEGLQLFSALVDKGVPTRMCLFHGENHELSRGGKPKHRVRRLREMTEWFTRYTK